MRYRVLFMRSNSHIYRVIAETYTEKEGAAVHRDAALFVYLFNRKYKNQFSVYNISCMD